MAIWLQDQDLRNPHIQKPEEDRLAVSETHLMVLAGRPAAVNHRQVIQGTRLHRAMKHFRFCVFRLQAGQTLWPCSVVNPIRLKRHVQTLQIIPAGRDLSRRLPQRRSLYPAQYLEDYQAPQKHREHVACPPVPPSPDVANVPRDVAIRRIPCHHIAPPAPCTTTEQSTILPPVCSAFEPLRFYSCRWISAPAKARNRLWTQRVRGPVLLHEHQIAFSWMKLRIRPGHLTQVRSAPFKLCGWYSPPGKAHERVGKETREINHSF